jgi:hypothetical protein
LIGADGGVDEIARLTGQPAPFASEGVSFRPAGLTAGILHVALCARQKFFKSLTKIYRETNHKMFEFCSVYL